MTEDLAYIERYFEGKFTSDEVTALDKRLHEDASFAEQFAFYISALSAAKKSADENKKERFREIYVENNANIVSKKPIVRKIWPYLAAAAIIGIVVSISIFRSASPDKLADQYIGRHLQNLSVTMDNRKSVFETGVHLYNEGKLPEALLVFENILQADRSNIKAKENAGIVSLRLGQYDKALQYFNDLENYPGLYANPGKFYHALTLMKRNRAGDIEQARALLRNVVDNRLDRANDAEALLEKL